jgi:hypothetical protein
VIQQKSDKKKEKAKSLKWVDHSTPKKIITLEIPPYEKC